MNTELVVASALMEVTRPRLHVAPVYDLTLLRVRQPTFTGTRWIFKVALMPLDAVILWKTAGAVLRGNGVY